MSTLSFFLVSILFLSYSSLLAIILCLIPEFQIVNIIRSSINSLLWFHKQYHNFCYRMAEEDYSKPRNLSLSMFGDDFAGLQLGQKSRVVTKPSNNNVRESKYQEQIDDDFLDLNLGAESKFVGKLNSASSTNSQKSQPKQNKQAITNASNNVVSKVQRRGRRPQGSKKAEPEKKAIDIDKQIGEIAQWAERGAKNNSDQQDFNDNQVNKVTQTEEKLQIRKKIEQKLKGGFNAGKQGGGLKAKAQQIRKQNQNKQKQEVKEQSSKQPKASEVQKKISPSRKQIEENAENSGIYINKKKQQPKANLISEEDQQDIDDHWNKINQRTVNQISKAEEKRKLMNIKTVTEYYQKEFQFEQQDIDDDMIGKNAEEVEEEKEEKGFFASLCACLNAPKKPKASKYNLALAKRIVAISKKQLSGVDEQFFILKEIWTRLTGKQFSRYGSHWNEIGFQGRDPATDLRSTGVLSLLQWLQFIDAHPKLSEKYYLWSLEQDFPLALTNIKLTGVFLDLLSQGLVKSQNWVGFQRSYNCLVLGMFEKMISKFKLGDTLGNFVEEQAKQVKKEFPKLLKSYNQEYKNLK